MTYTLRYRSTRTDVWRSYWRAWRSRLWRIHAVFAVTLGLVMSRFVPNLNDVAGYVAAAAIAFFVAVVVSVAFSQLAFKSAERTLVVNDEGWTTHIGGKSGAKKWQETTPVYEQAGTVVIANRNGNALVIPHSAFSSDTERNQFLLDVRNWQQHVG